MRTNPGASKRAGEWVADYVRRVHPDGERGELDYAARTKDLQQADALMAHDGFTLPLFALPEYAVTDGSIVATAQDGTKQGVQDSHEMALT